MTEPCWPLGEVAIKGRSKGASRKDKLTQRALASPGKQTSVVQIFAPFILLLAMETVYKLDQREDWTLFRKARLGHCLLKYEKNVLFL